MLKKLSHFLISKRFIILGLIGVGTYYAITMFNISLWTILGIGLLSGFVFGKVYCRWACPMGFLMEIMMSFNPNGKFVQMYQYNKLGCPIAWGTGYLNRMSFFKIKINKDSCTSCGLCDKQCYISSLEPEKYSIYKTEKLDPGTSYTCSKCLKCVEACPNGSLRYKLDF